MKSKLSTIPSTSAKWCSTAPGSQTLPFRSHGFLISVRYNTQLLGQVSGNSTWCSLEQFSFCQASPWEIGRKDDIVSCQHWSYPAILALSNERADSAAKSALDLPHAKVGVPYNDFKHCISQYILSTWQDDWNVAVANKLHSVKPVLGDWQSSYRRCRKEEVVLCRARIGHTHLSHSYILRKDPPPQCERCQYIQTARYILVECNHFAEKRERYIWWHYLESTPHSFYSIYNKF